MRSRHHGGEEIGPHMQTPARTCVSFPNASTCSLSVSIMSKRKRVTLNYHSVIVPSLRMHLLTLTPWGKESQFAQARGQAKISHTGSIDQAMELYKIPRYMDSIAILHLKQTEAGPCLIASLDRPSLRLMFNAHRFDRGQHDRKPPRINGVLGWP